MTYDPTCRLHGSWQFTEGVVDAGFEYGPDREVTGLPAAPASGVKVRVGNPTQNQIAVAAASVGYETTDKVVTLWSSRLRADPENPASTLIEPMEGDFVIVSSVRWLIKSLKETLYSTQYICYCQRDTSAAPVSQS